MAHPDGRYKTAQDIAQASGVLSSTISRIMSAARRPDPDTLKALCTQIPDASDGLHLLVAHLRDEIGRAGRRQSEIAIEASEVVDDIRLLLDEAETDEDIRTLLHDLAVLVRKQRRRDYLAAAEESAPYNPKQSQTQS